MNRKTIYLLAAAASVAITFPAWGKVIYPQMFSEVACVIEEPDGDVVKAWGEEACVNNGMPTVVLRVK